MKIINRITNIICIIIIAAMVVILILNWNSLPDKVPTHFSFDGTPNAFGSKATLLIEPIIAIVLFVLISVAKHFPKAWNFPIKITAENKKREYMIASIMLNAINVLITLLLLITLLSATISDFPTWPMLIGVAIILVVPIAGTVLMFKAR